MDEVRMVRERYPEPAPPTVQEITRAKALLNEPPRRPLPRLWWGMGGVVVVGTAATMAIVLAGGSTPGTPSTPDPVRLDGKGAFLVAAKKAELQAVGKYWYADGIDGQSSIMRAKTGTYAITSAHSESFSWRGVKPGMGEAYYIRDLPARPLTAQDAVLWRKAGSPSSFRVWSGDAHHTYTTRVMKWRSSGPEVGTDPGGGGEFMGKSLQELLNLPSAPAKLAEMFLSDAEMSKAAGPASGKRSQRIHPGVKIFRVASLLGGAPIPPKVRAGLMRALAAQPGIRAIGHATDPLGRRGIALAAEDRAVTVTGEYGGPKADQGTYRSREVIIFDERTGALLSRQDQLTTPGGRYAEMKPGFIIEYSTLRSVSWTDSKPTPPAKLPFG